MAGEREILKYEIDLTDVEAKARRLLELKQQIDSTRGSGGDSGALEQELRDTAGGFEEVARGGKRATEELFDFERKGEKVVKGVLGVMSPQLAAAADMAIDLAEGFNKVSPALLAVAGAGAAIGVITAAMQSMVAAAQAAIEKMERLSEAQRKMRDASVNSRAEFADAALKLGIDPAAGSAAMNSRMIQLTQGQGTGMQEMPLQMAKETAKAAVFAASRGMEFDDRKFAAGLAKARGEMPTFNSPGEYQAVVTTLMRAGDNPDAQRVLSSYLNANLQKTRRENAALPMGDVAPMAVDADTILDEKVARGDITAQQAELARAYYNDKKAYRDARSLEEAMAGGRGGVFGNTDVSFFTDRAGLTSNNQRIALEVVEQLIREVQAREATVGGAIVPHTVIIGSAYFGGGNALRNPNFESPLHAPGGGLHRNGVE